MSCKITLKRMEGPIFSSFKFSFICLLACLFPTTDHSLMLESFIIQITEMLVGRVAALEWDLN